MPYSYEDLRRARLVYVLGLVVISGGLGFLGGRFSALWVPVGTHSLGTALGRVASEASRDGDQSQSRVAQRGPPEAASHNKDPGQNSQSSMEQPGLIDGTPGPSQSRVREARNVPPTPEQADSDVVLGATVINSGSARPDTDPEKDRAGNASKQLDAANARNNAGNTECARRYASARAMVPTSPIILRNAGPARFCVRGVSGHVWEPLYGIAVVSA
jgi:hypothetical protein